MTEEFRPNCLKSKHRQAHANSSLFRGSYKAFRTYQLTEIGNNDLLAFPFFFFFADRPLELRIIRLCSAPRILCSFVHDEAFYGPLNTQMTTVQPKLESATTECGTILFAGIEAARAAEVHTAVAFKNQW